MKVGNIGRLDPDLKEQGITGLIHGVKMEEEVWNEFYGNPEYLAYESERLIAEFAKQSIEQSSNIAVEDLPQTFILSPQKKIKKKSKKILQKKKVSLPLYS